MLFYNALNGIGAKLLRPVHARPLRWQRWKGGRGKEKEGNPGQKGGRGRGGNLVSLAGLGTPGDPWIQGRMGLRTGGGLGKGWNPTGAAEIVCPASLLYNMGKLRLKPARMALLEPRCALDPGGLGGCDIRPPLRALWTPSLPSCGHCKQNKPCSADTGNCEACEPGWNGTQCHQPCPPGTFGENCRQQCPRCWLGEACQPDTGHCQRCEPGWRGPR